MMEFGDSEGTFTIKKFFSLFSQIALRIAKLSKPDPPEQFCRLRRTREQKVEIDGIWPF